MSFTIYSFDTQHHGEATLILFDSIIHIVDFGINAYNRYVSILNVVNEARRIIKSMSESSNVEAVITHLHIDHFGLISNIVDKLNVVYIPGIPMEPPELRDYFLMLNAINLVLLDMIGWSRALEEVLNKSDYNIKHLYRGDLVPIDNHIMMKIIWPPISFQNMSRAEEIIDELINYLQFLYFIANEAVKKHEAGKKVKEKIEWLCKIYDIKPPLTEEYEELCSKNSVYSYSKHKRCILPKESVDINRLLRCIDKALNDFSLVIEYRYHKDGEDLPIIIIPGDASNKILNYIALLEKGKKKDICLFMRGAHHGTHYGKYLDLYAPIVTWLSRPPQAYPYRREYKDITLLKVLKAKMFRKMKFSASLINKYSILAHLSADANKYSSLVTSITYDINASIHLNIKVKNTIQSK